MSRTGHHSVDGVRVYKRTTTVLQEMSSAILNGVTSGDAKEETTTSRKAKQENATVVKEETTMPRETMQAGILKWTLAMLQTSQLILTLTQSRYIPETMLITLFCK